MSKYCQNCGVKLEGEPAFCSECGFDMGKWESKYEKPQCDNGSQIRTWLNTGNRKTFLFLIIAVAIVLILVSLSISTGVVKNAADDFNSSEDVNDDEINELQQPKNWEERIIITSGPWGELIRTHIIEYTKPYYIKSDIWRVNWSMQGTNCNFEFKVWKVGNIGSSNHIDTIYSDEASDTLDIDDGAGYYYFELSFENLNYYQFRISEYV